MDSYSFTNVEDSSAWLEFLLHSDSIRSTAGSMIAFLGVGRER